MILKDFLRILSHRFIWFAGGFLICLAAYIALFLSEQTYWIARSRIIVEVPRTPFHAEHTEWLSSHLVQAQTWQVLIKGKPVMDKAYAYIIEKYPGTEHSLLNNIKVIEQPKTSIAFIEASGPSQEKAIFISSMVAKAAQEYGFEKANTDLMNAEKRANEMIKRNKDSIEELEIQQSAIQATITSKLGVGDVEKEYQRLASEVVRLDQKKRDLGLKIEGNRSKIASINRRRELAKMPSYRDFVIEKTSKIISLEKELESLSQTLKKELKTLTEDHPRIKSIREQIGELEVELVTARKEALIVELSVEEQKLSTEIALLEDEIKAIDIQLLELKNLYTDITEPHNRYKKLESDIMDLKTRNSDLSKLISQFKTSYKGGYIHLHEIASEDSCVLSEKTSSKMLGVALIVAIIFAVACAYLVEILDTTIRTDLDVKRSLGYDILGVVPVLKPEHVLLMNTPTSPMNDVFDTVFTVLNSVSNTKIIVCGGAQIEEGKSSIAINLSTMIARRKYKTCLVDCDLRRPVIHKIFNVNSEPGFSDVCLGGSDVARAAQQSMIKNLYILSSGTKNTDLYGLFDQRILEIVMSQLRENFDYVVIDTPPLSLASEAVKLSTVGDGLVLVIGAGKLDQTQAGWIKHLLNRVGTKVLGVVLNKARLSMEKYYYYYYRGDE